VKIKNYWPEAGKLMAKVASIVPPVPLMGHQWPRFRVFVDYPRDAYYLVIYIILKIIGIRISQ
jgi:hypothetical protein